MAQWSKFIGRGAVMNFGNHKRAILLPRATSLYFRSPRWHYFCSVERKSNQKRPFPHRAERAHNHRRSLYKLIFSLLFLLTFSAIFSRCLSVIMRFLLPASRVVFSAHLCLKQLSSIVTATFCYCHALYISHCLPLPFTPYSLP